VQSLTVLRGVHGEFFLALCQDGCEGRAGSVVFAAMGPHRLRYHGFARMPDHDSPQALSSWGSMLAVACEGARSSPRLLLFDAPIERAEPRLLDKLTFEGSMPMARCERSGARWLAWTRLACGRYLGVTGGYEQGQPYGRALLYTPDAALGQRFSALGAYGPFHTGPRIEFTGSRLGAVTNASFLVGTDLQIYLAAIESEGHLAYARLKLFVAQAVSDDVPLHFRLVTEEIVHARGSSSFRYGACVRALPTGRLGALCSERELGSSVSVYEIEGAASEAL
jgi:hypothetical protein